MYNDYKALEEPLHKALLQGPFIWVVKTCQKQHRHCFWLPGCQVPPAESGLFASSLKQMYNDIGALERSLLKPLLQESFIWDLKSSIATAFGFWAVTRSPHNLASLQSTSNTCIMITKPWKSRCTRHCYRDLSFELYKHARSSVGTAFGFWAVKCPEHNLARRQVLSNRSSFVMDPWKSCARQCCRDLSFELYKHARSSFATAWCGWAVRCHEHDLA